jgi:hypothetical protein
MKKKISRIMGVVLTAVLLCSLIAIPVSANISQPSVTLEDDTISTTSDYTILFQVTDEVPTTGSIEIEFPEETTIGTITDTNLTVQTTAGFGTAISETAALAANVTVVDETVTIDLTNMPNAIGDFAQVKVFFDGVITNPDDPDDYTLTASTSEETTAVESAPYTIEAPDVGDLPGIVQLFNPSEILITQETGAGAIATVIGLAGEDFTIKIGPGTYTENPTTAADGVTFVATGAADSTIIKGDFTISNDEITVDGLTIQGEMTITGDETTITACVFEKSDDADEVLLSYSTAVATEGSEIDTCIFDTTNEDADNDIGLQLVTDGMDVSDCSFIVDEEDIALHVNDVNDIEDCEFVGGSGWGVWVTGGAPNIEGCTFDGLDLAFHIDAGTPNIHFNDIINLSDDYAVDTAVAVMPIHNYWGTDDADDIEDLMDGTGTVTFEPFLPGPVDDTIASWAFAVGADELDAEDDAGVIVEDATDASLIVAAIYKSNPAESLENATDFFEIFAADVTPDTVTVKIFGGDENAELYIWSMATEAWVLLPTDEDYNFGYSTYGGYIYAEVESDMLCGTPFAIAAAPPPEPEMQAEVQLISPTAGGTGVQLSPTFAWSDVGTPFYEFQLSDNPYFAEPLISDSPKLRAPYFDYPADLEYSKTYFWRVRSSISGATSVCVDTQCGPWAMGIFTTMDEPVEPPEIVFPEPQPPVVIPPVQEITPSWIYVIIGVGALLVIAVIVLIVTTRRAAP